MKFVLGITGSIIGTLACLAVLNLIVYGGHTNWDLMLRVSLLLGLINGIIIAFVSHNKDKMPTYSDFAFSGALGMVVLYVVMFIAFWAFLVPVLHQTALQFVFNGGMLMVIGAVSGVSYGALYRRCRVPSTN